MTLQKLFFSAPVGGEAADWSGKRIDLGRLRLPKPHHRGSPVIDKSKILKGRSAGALAA